MRDTQQWSLLIRRHPDTGEMAYYRCYTPDVVPLRELVRVAFKGQARGLAVVHLPSTAARWRDPHPGHHDGGR